MTIAAGWYLIWQPSILNGADTTPAGPDLLTRLWLRLIATLTGLWGLALFMTDQGFSSLIWVWPGDLLTSRLIAVMLLSISVGAVASLRDADLSRVMLAVTLTYGLGLALASLWNAFAAKPVKLAYLLVFGLIFIGSTLLLLRKRSFTTERRVTGSI